MADDKLKRPHTTEEEAAINKQLDGLMLKMREEKKEVAGHNNELWEKLYDLYAGGDRHWNGYSGNIPKSARISLPLIERNTQIKLGLLSDMDTGYEIVPVEQSDEIQAYLLDTLSKYWWSKFHVSHKVKSSVLDALILGTGIMKVYYDYDLDDINARAIPPEDMWVLPGTTDFTRDECAGCCYRTKMDIAVVQAKWVIEPETRSEVDDGTEFRKSNPDSVDPSAQGTALHVVGPTESAATTTTTYIPGAHIHDSDRNKMVWVEEWWLDDTDVEKYPGGRMIIRVGNRIVEDKNNPYKHCQWPFVRFIDELVPHRFWGDTTLRHAGPLQRQIDILESLIIYNTHIQTSSVTYTYQNGIPARKLMAAMGVPGMVFTLQNKMLKPDRDYANPLPSGILSYVAEKIEQLNKVMRVQEVIPPGSRGYPSSGHVVEKLQETQQVEIRETGDYVAEGILRIGEQAIGLMQQYYNRKRTVRILGPEPEALAGLKDPKTGKPVLETDKRNKKVHYLHVNPDNIKGQFDFLPEESTYKPYSAQARYDMLMDLQERFPDDITILHVLREANLKGKAQIIKDHNERVQAEQEPPPQEQGPPPDMMMGGMPPPGGMMPPGGGPPPGMGGPPPMMGQPM